MADEPWVTVAESCELVLSLAAVGETERAREIYEWCFQWTDDEGVFWTGYQFADEEYWPGDRRRGPAGRRCWPRTRCRGCRGPRSCLLIPARKESKRQHERVM